jgi:hypothetical protein
MSTDEHEKIAFSETFARYVNGYALELLEKAKIQPFSWNGPSNAFGLRILESSNEETKGWVIEVTLEDKDDVRDTRELLVGRTDVFDFSVNPFDDTRVLDSLQSLVERYITIRERVRRFNQHLTAQERHSQGRD